MFKSWKQIFLSIFFSFVFIGCIKDVVIKDSSEKHELVLNCILDTTKDTVYVQLNYSKAIQATEPFEPTKNAQIQLFEEGRMIGEFIWTDSSAYALPYQVIAGKMYRIEATTGNNKVWAETTVPKAVDATINKSFFGNGSYIIRLKHNSEDPIFYWISAMGYEGSADNQEINIACELYSNFEYADDFNRRIGQNSMYKFEYIYYIRFTGNEQPAGLTEVIFYPQCINNPVEVFLLSVDYHLDKYMKSSLLLQNMDLFAREMPIVYAPFPMYSNTNGGTGIFGSYNSVSEKFDGK